MIASKGLSAFASTLLLAAAAPPARALDPGEDGARVTIPVSALADSAYAVAVDPNGRLVLAGTNAGSASVLAGLLPSGALDAGFGTGGIAIHDLAPTQGDQLRALARLGDGRYAGCGSYFSAGTASDFVVARFDADGSLDLTFDGVGFAVVPFLQSGPGGSLYDQCNAVAVQADGMIVAAGLTYETGPSSVALTRHTASGAPDAAFGNGGKVDINPSSAPNGNAEARALAIQPDGKLVVAGFAYGVGNAEFLVMRLDADGTPDGTFGTGGIVRTPIGNGEDIANAIVLQPDGRIVVAGSTIAADGRRDFALARYLANGALDATFGSGGIVTTPIGPGDDVAYALARMPWGRLVAAGSARISTSAAGTDLALVAYDADGTRDGYFGDAGVRMLSISDGDVAYGLASDIGGAHFWAVGTAAAGATQDFLAVEFGLPDTIFRHGFDTNTAP